MSFLGMVALLGVTVAGHVQVEVGLADVIFGPVVGSHSARLVAVRTRLMLVLE